MANVVVFWSYLDPPNVSCGHNIVHADSGLV